jgi:hypothetical protein
MSKTAAEAEEQTFEGNLCFTWSLYHSGRLWRFGPGAAMPSLDVQETGPCGHCICYSNDGLPVGWS